MHQQRRNKHKAGDLRKKFSHEQKEARADASLSRKLDRIDCFVNTSQALF